MSEREGGGGAEGEPDTGFNQHDTAYFDQDDEPPTLIGFIYGRAPFQSLPALLGKRPSVIQVPCDYRWLYESVYNE